MTTTRARNWAELARLLTEGGIHIDRRTIQRKRDEYNDFPVPSSDGSHSVPAWAAWLVSKGYNGMGERQGEAIIFPEGEKSDWEKLLLVEKVEQAKVETQKQRGALLVAADLEVAMGQLLAGISAGLNHLPSASARFVRGIKDVHVVQEKLQAQVDAILQRFNAAEFLSASAIEEEVANLCDGPEAERLTELVKTVFAGIGRRAIADAQGMTLSQDASEAYAIATTAPLGEGETEPDPSAEVKKKPKR